MRGNELLAMLRSSYAAAKSRSPAVSRPEPFHRSRSQTWVDELARRFQRRYRESSGYRVFWLRNSLNKKEFGLNELLFDIAVCKVSGAKSAVQNKDFHFVSQAVWQVESEFANNTRQALFDFNKLLLGNAKFKLFVAPLAKHMAEYEDTLAHAARSCPGVLYVAVVPHPRDWDRHRPSAIKLIRFHKGRWKAQE